MGQRVGGAVKYNDAKSTTLCTLALHQRELGVSMRTVIEVRNLTSIGSQPKAKGLPRRTQVYKKLRITKWF